MSGANVLRFTAGDRVRILTGPAVGRIAKVEMYRVTGTFYEYVLSLGRDVLEGWFRHEDLEAA